MRVTNTFLAALLIGISATTFASQVSAQVDTQKAPPGPVNQITEHRAAALRTCTDGIKFASDRYVACMLREGENP
jgi:hypothetical protein